MGRGGTAKAGFGDRMWRVPEAIGLCFQKDALVTVAGEQSRELTELM